MEVDVADVLRGGDDAGHGITPSLPESFSGRPGQSGFGANVKAEERSARGEGQARVWGRQPPPVEAVAPEGSHASPGSEGAQLALTRNSVSQRQWEMTVALGLL